MHFTEAWFACFLHLLIDFYITTSAEFFSFSFGHRYLLWWSLSRCPNVKLQLNIFVVFVT